MLTVILALITQVIGGSAARAFTLVGALAIVRFRTRVNDTRDTAYVILAVCVGMAIGLRLLPHRLARHPCRRFGRRLFAVSRLRRHASGRHLSARCAIRS